MLHKNKFKIFLFVLTIGLISLTGINSWNPVMGQTSGENRQSRVNSTPTSIVAQKTENVTVSTFGVGGRTPLQFRETINQFPEGQTLNAKRVRVTTGPEPAYVIVIYNKHGDVVVCIGSAKACKELMTPTETTKE